MNEKIGIIGGTFDPIHYGHLMLAENIRIEAGLDKILFIPAKIPPHKLDAEISEDAHRLKMVQLAIASNPYFMCSDIEIASNEISYTINTLDKLKLQYGSETKLYFIIGADMAVDLEKWWDSMRLLEEHAFIVGRRPGYPDEELKRHISYLQSKYDSDITICETMEIDISSTLMKTRVAAGKSVKYMTEQDVVEYIDRQRLYLK